MAQIMLLGIPADHNPDKPYLGQLTPLSTGDTVVTYSGVTIPIGNGSGYSGYSGFSGPQGASGFSGFSGYSGKSGFSGAQGFSGYSGASGRVGTSGFSGKSGLSGYSGISGYSGFSGAGGSTGTSGYSGYSGYSGFSGRSGYSGMSGYSGVGGGGGGKTIRMYEDMFAFATPAGGWQTIRQQRMFADPTRIDTSEDIKVTVRGQTWYWVSTGMFGYGAVTGNSDVRVTLFDRQGTPAFVSGFSALPDVSKRTARTSYTTYPDYTQDSYVNFELNAGTLRTLRQFGGEFWTLKLDVYNPGQYSYSYMTTFYSSSRISGLAVTATPANELAGDTVASRYSASNYSIETYPAGATTLQRWKVRSRPTSYVHQSYVAGIDTNDTRNKFVAVIAGDFNHDLSYQAYFTVTPKYTDGGATTALKLAPFNTPSFISDLDDSVRFAVGGCLPGLQYTIDLVAIQGPYIYTYGSPSVLWHAEVWNIG